MLRSETQLLTISQNNVAFKQRENRRKSSIENGIVLINTMPFAIDDFRHFDALKRNIIFDKWYKVIFELRESCRKSTIANGIVLIQYNAVCDR